jgi:histidinol-phosphate/aromatic aminotransferase/cobyric acid decarboxylase-like protein
MNLNKYKKEQLKRLKLESGSHSPSIDTILSMLEIDLKIDACFLSNPYATDLFWEYFNRELIETSKLKSLLEYYPPQNRSIAQSLSLAIGVDKRKIFIGNGAIEIIQAVLHNFVYDSICLILPTFSSYYEFLPDNINVKYYFLKKDNDFLLDVEDYISFVKSSKVKSIVLINPNNPNGFYTTREEILKILNELNYLDLIVIDESFIHFAFEDSSFELIDNNKFINQFDNLVIIKSLSKDFGVAGIRCGYSIMNETRVDELLNKGYLWNVSGISNYFLKLYARSEFQKDYEIIRKKYIRDTRYFINKLKDIPEIKCYDSFANFVLVELPQSWNSFDFSIELLFNHGVYVRDCSDKIGLDGSFIRVASRTFDENLIILDGLTLTSNYFK